METKKISETEYEVYIYCWVELHDDYVCGHIKFDSSADEDSDLRFWMFYPSCGKPINCGDLRRIFEFISELNKDK